MWNSRHFLSVYPPEWPDSAGGGCCRLPPGHIWPSKGPHWGQSLWTPSATHLHWARTTPLTNLYHSRTHPPTQTSWSPNPPYQPTNLEGTGWIHLSICLRHLMVVVQQQFKRWLYRDHSLQICVWKTFGHALHAQWKRWIYSVCPQPCHCYESLQTNFWDDSFKPHTPTSSFHISANMARGCLHLCRFSHSVGRQLKERGTGHRDEKTLP